MTEELNATEEKPLKKKVFYLAKGKAITTLVGILADGDEIRPENVIGGKKTIDAFVKSGHIVK